MTLKSWNKRRLGEQRRQAARAAAGLRGGRGRGRDSTGRGSGRGPGGRFATGVVGYAPARGDGGRGGSKVAAAVPPCVPSWLGNTSGLPVSPPPGRQGPPVPLHPSQQPAVLARRQQELSDEELARRLQEQFYAEARAERIAAADGASRSSDSHDPLTAAGPNPPGPEAGWGGALQEAGSRAGREDEAAGEHAGSVLSPHLAGTADVSSSTGVQDLATDELLPWLATPAQPLAAQAALMSPGSTHTPGNAPPVDVAHATAARPPARTALPAAPAGGTSAAAPQIGTSAPATTASVAAASGVGAEEELEDMLALLGVQQ